MRRRLSTHEQTLQTLQMRSRKEAAVNTFTAIMCFHIILEDVDNSKDLLWILQQELLLLRRKEDNNNPRINESSGNVSPSLDVRGVRHLLLTNHNVLT